MENKIRYPEHFAPVAQDEMVYLTGGSILDDVGDAVDGAVHATSTAINVVDVVATVVGRLRPGRELHLGHPAVQAVAG